MELPADVTAALFDDVECFLDSTHVFDILGFIN